MNPNESDDPDSSLELRGFLNTLFAAAKIPVDYGYFFIY